MQRFAMRCWMPSNPEGYRVLSAANGLEALEVLSILPTPPSVILLGPIMPAMDGWEFRAEQQRHPLLSKIPVFQPLAMSRKR